MYLAFGTALLLSFTANWMERKCTRQYSVLHLEFSQLKSLIQDLWLPKIFSVEKIPPYFRKSWKNNTISRRIFVKVIRDDLSVFLLLAADFYRKTNQIPKHWSMTHSLVLPWLHTPLLFCQWFLENTVSQGLESSEYCILYVKRSLYDTLQLRKHSCTRASAYFFFNALRWTITALLKETTRPLLS